MKIRVNPHNVEIVREQTEPINELEVKVSKCEFEFDDKITNEFVKEAYFTLNGSTYKQIIVNNECDYPNEVLTEKGTLEIGVVAYKVENEEEIKRYNPSPAYFNTWVGSLKEAENSEPITPSDKEQIEQQLLNISTQMDNLDVEASKVEHTTTITITRKDGTSYDVLVLDGEKGDKGDKGEAGAIKMQIVNELPETGSDDTIYLVPNDDPETGNNYDEYIYVNGAWEKLGGIQVEVDLTDYVKNTDYATTDIGGVIKVGWYNTSLDSQGHIYANTRTYAQYTGDNNSFIISKGTLENVITGKGLVSNTQYANTTTGGVIKTGGGYGARMDSNGNISASSYDYTTYSSLSNYALMSKGTLENVLTARIGDIDSVLDAINGEVI